VDEIEVLPGARTQVLVEGCTGGPPDADEILDMVSPITHPDSIDAIFG
jgi:hypothetical protein